MTDLPPPINPRQLRDSLIYEPPDLIWSNKGWYRSKMDLMAGKSIPLLEVVHHFAERIFEAKRGDWPDMVWNVDQSERGNLRAFLYPLGYNLGAPGFQNALGPMHVSETDWVLREHLERFVRFVEDSLRKHWWEEHGKPWDVDEFLAWLKEQWEKHWYRRVAEARVTVLTDSLAPRDQHVLTWLNEEEWQQYHDTGGPPYPMFYEYRLEIHPQAHMDLRKRLWDLEDKTRQGTEEAGYLFFGRFAPMVNFDEGH